MAIPKSLKLWFSKHNEVIFATTEGTQPRMRPMTLIYDDQGFFFATDLKSDKVSQLRENPGSEFLLQIVDGNNHGYIRCECSSMEIKDIKLREKLFKENNFMSDHWKGFDDPALTIIQLKPVTLYILEPGKTVVKAIEAKI